LHKGANYESALNNNTTGVEMKKRNKILVISALLFSIFIFYSFLVQQPILAVDDNETCLDCHDDDSITMEKRGREISLTVKRYELPRSVHSGIKCIDCHQGFDPYDIPHKEHITPVNCTNCHIDFAETHPFHPQMKDATGIGGTANLDCKGCHGTHQVASKADPKSPTYFQNSTEFCGKCHTAEKEEHLLSEHYLDPKMKLHRNVPNCIHCHTQPITPGHSKDIAELKLNQERLCLNCHLEDPMKLSRFAESLINYEQSVHGLALIAGNFEAAVCVDCHTSHRMQKRDVPTSSVHHQNISTTCGSCHVDITKEYMKSVHGQSLLKQSPDAATCTDCHGEHEIAKVPNIPRQVFTEMGMNFDVVVDNQMIYCIACHADEDMMSKYNLLTVAKAHEWLPSKAKHWETIRCIDCHSSYEPPNLSHNILPRHETLRNCEECHSQSSMLMSKLYVHEAQKSREQMGFINGVLLSDAYVIGSTRNVYLDWLSFIIFGLTFMGIAGHGFLRWYFRKKK